MQNVLREETAFMANVNGTPEVMQHYGAFAEARFLQVCVESFGLAELPPSAVKDEKKPEYAAIVRAKEMTDYEEGIDFFVFLPQLDKWVPIDITVSNDEKVLQRKREKEERTGIKLVKLNDWDLRNSTDTDIRVAKDACQNIAKTLMKALER